MSSTSEIYRISVEDASLTLQKSKTAKVNFDDGVVLAIEGKPQPRHLQFYCKTDASGSDEACDIRISKLRTAPQFTWPIPGTEQPEPLEPKDDVA